MLVCIFWAVGIVLIIAQTTLLEYLPLWLGRPDLIFVLVAFIAYRFAWIPGIVLVFALSWVMDVVAGIYLGLYPLVCLLAFAALKTLTNKNPIKESTYQIPLVGLSYFLMQILFYFLNSILLPDMLPEWSWPGALQRTMLVVLSAVPLFILFNRLYEYILKRRLQGKPPRRRSQRPI
jgi:rod shape-determining protein MreD